MWWLISSTILYTWELFLYRLWQDKLDKEITRKKELKSLTNKRKDIGIKETSARVLRGENVDIHAPWTIF